MALAGPVLLVVQFQFSVFTFLQLIFKRQGHFKRKEKISVGQIILTVTAGHMGHSDPDNKRCGTEEGVHSHCVT